MDNIFRAKRVTATPEEIEAVRQEVVQLDNELARATGTEPMRDLNYGDHVRQVQELSDKIVDIFEANDYTTTVALDALEAVLRGGVTLSLGDDAGRLLERHLRRFHQELTTIQIIEMIGGVLGGGRKRQSLEDLLKEMKGAGGEKRDESKS